MGTQKMNGSGCCYIFGAAHISDYGYITIKPKSTDYVICADGGYRHTRAIGIQADAVIGDFDSSDKPENEFVVEYPSKKDDTDTMLAVKTGLAAGYKRFKIYGALGGRFDHSVANISALFYLNMHDASGELIDEKNIVYSLCGESGITIPKRSGFKISLLPFSDRVTGVSVENLVYPLNDAVLTNSFPLGVSNEFAGLSAKISIKSGSMIIVVSKD